MPAAETVDSHLGRGYEDLKLERYEQAAAEFRAALELDPSLAMRARFPLAVALFELKDSGAARREFDAVRRQAGDRTNIFYYLGRLDLQGQNFTGAIRNLTNAVADPPFPDTAYYLGFACLKQGDLSAAEKWLKLAQQANPSDGAVLFQLGALYRKQGRQEQANEAFARSTELRRRAAEATELRHECATQLEHAALDEARAVCSRLYDEGDAAKLTALGTVYGEHHQYAAALEPLRRAAELAPQSPQMQYNLAFTLYQMNRYEEASQPIAQAVKRWPDIFQLNSLYGAVLCKLGREREALPVLRRAHQLNPEDTRTAELLYRTMLSLARASLASREYSAALPLFEEAAKLRPEDEEPKRGIAQAKAAEHSE